MKQVLVICLQGNQEPPRSEPRLGDDHRGPEIIILTPLPAVPAPAAQVLQVQLHIVQHQHVVVIVAAGRLVVAGRCACRSCGGGDPGGTQPAKARDKVEIKISPRTMGPPRLE